MAQCAQFILRICFFATAIATNCTAAERSAAPCRATTQIVSIDPSLSTSVMAPTPGAVTGQPAPLEWEIEDRSATRTHISSLAHPKQFGFRVMAL